MERINEIKIGFFEINKIDNSLAKLSKKIREKAQITNIRNERGNIIIDPTSIKRTNYE